MPNVWSFRFAGVCLAALTAWGQEAAQLPPVRTFQLPPRVGIVGEQQLSLEQVLTLALANNRDIDISRIDQERARYNITSAEGVYDPRVGGVASFQNNVIPIASALGGSASGSVTNRNMTLDPQVTGEVPRVGGLYSVDFANGRTTTNNTFTQLNPQIPTSLNFSYTQPIMRGFRYDNNRRRIDVAKKNSALTNEQFRERVMNTLATAEASYWDLAFAYSNLAVQLDAVRIAQEQDASNRRQEEQGLLAAIDVVAAQRQLATYEQTALGAQENVMTAENALKVLILPDRGDPMWSVAFVPTTPVNVAPPIVPLTDAINEALANRPELAQLRITRDINAVDNKYFVEQTRPQVDVIASHTNAGLAGTQLPLANNPFTSGQAAATERLNLLSTLAGLPTLPPTGGGTNAGVPPFLLGGYGRSLANLFSGNFPTTQVQVRVSLPLKNRTAEADLANNLAEARQIRNRQQQAELSIEASVRNTMQAVELSKARLDSARVARRSAEEQYESEQRQFRAGTSTLFLVQERQNDMIVARSQELRVQSELGKAIALFELATGRTITVHNIDLK
jgi:HAE1 family hydrophobic/amphiphilic exporter-1